MAVHNSMCVIITVHQPYMSAEEEVSLLACYRHLKAYDCFLVFPAGMDTVSYQHIHPQLILQPVAPEWLSSILHYNRMKVNPSFYALFSDYQFMMTYELDAYIFSSDIAAHHGFDYDFIGSPIFEGFMNATPGAPFMEMLNSGFSIRNISIGRKALKRLRQYRVIWKGYRFLLSNAAWLCKMVPASTRELIYNYHLTNYYKGFDFNEDIIWSQVFPAIYPAFRVAPLERAYRFGFEVNAAELYELNHHRLPLGCHAWSKFPGFWKTYIER
ncbi:DUF5672 family protein [Chitinophaga flava]|uniref:DUF5672 domain-containing protein n=1 Tax=Chitinophaga flava TaxID=2259036 RepID=A0A365Y5J7_9BACT|nr:DUF5672 family protein [Chitinophaga flava]RBL93862.1 hypothetical protein DF182_15325 [Chitinophaga flava]